MREFFKTIIVLSAMSLMILVGSSIVWLVLYALAVKTLGGGL
jgi:hypothetical protein